MSRRGYDDPWTPGYAWRGHARRVLTFVLTVVLVCLSVYVGRLSVPPPATPSIPAQVAGATRMNGDVPVGYARTRDGAVAAATNYSAVLAGPLILEPSRYRAAEDVIASASARAGVTAEGEQAIASVEASTNAIALAQRGVRVVVRYAPLAYRVAAYDAGRATVAIWGLWLVGEQGLLTPTETWSTRTIVLEWTGGDWKLNSSSTSPGPTPQPGQQPAQTSAMPPQLTDFEEYIHASR
jgi:hypothetical protein